MWRKNTSSINEVRKESIRVNSDFVTDILEHCKFQHLIVGKDIHMLSTSHKNPISYYVILCILVVLVGFILGIAVVFPDTFADIIHLPREAVVSNVQAEMDSLMEIVAGHNSDTLLETRIVNPISRGKGRMFSYCIGGLTELIYQSSQPLNEVARNYASLWGVEVKENQLTQIEPNEVWYSVPINDKSKLLLTPINRLIPSGDPSLSTPFPTVCKNPGSCYEVGVYYDDPSLQSCRP